MSRFGQDVFISSIPAVLFGNDCCLQKQQTTRRHLGNEEGLPGMTSVSSCDSGTLYSWRRCDRWHQKHQRTLVVMATWTEVPVLTSSEESVWDMKQQQYSGPCLVVEHTAVQTSTSQDNNTYKQVLHWVDIVCCGALTPLLTILGLPGNVLSAAVFYRQGLRERINLCLFALAVVDLIVVIVIFIINSELLYRQVSGPSWVVTPIICGLFGSVWASHFLSAVIASERCFCVVSPFHAKRLLKTSTMAAIIVVGCTLLTGGMCAIVAPKHISVCTFDPLTNITDNIVYVTKYYLTNKTIIDIFDIFVYATALPGIFLSVIIVATVITSVKLRAALAWRQSTVSKTTTATSTTSSDGQGDLKMSRKEASVTLMLMATSVLFIMCITPNFLLQVTTLVVPEFSQTGLYHYLISSCWRIVYCFWMINSCFTFFVYFKMGSKFRGMVKEMLSKRRGYNDKGHQWSSKE